MGFKAIAKENKELSNWSCWGPEDQIGTLNLVAPEMIAKAATLATKGKVFDMGILLGSTGPQNGLFGGRWSPIHTMLATCTDAVKGCFDDPVSIRYANDVIDMPVQAATHWDSLGHVFDQDKMHKGHDAKNVDSGGVHKLGMEHARDKMVGRAVLLDVARQRGVDWVANGEGISNDELDAVAAA